MNSLTWSERVEMAEEERELCTIGELRDEIDDDVDEPGYEFQRHERRRLRSKIKASAGPEYGEMAAKPDEPGIPMEPEEAEPEYRTQRELKRNSKKKNAGSHKFLDRGRSQTPRGRGQTKRGSSRRSPSNPTEEFPPLSTRTRSKFQPSSSMHAQLAAAQGRAPNGTSTPRVSASSTSTAGSAATGQATPSAPASATAFATNDSSSSAAGSSTGGAQTTMYPTAAVVMTNGTAATTATMTMSALTTTAAAVNTATVVATSAAVPTTTVTPSTSLNTSLNTAASTIPASNSPSNSILIMRNLPSNANDNDVMALAHSVGAFHFCYVERGPEGRSHGVAYIRFVTMEAEKEALKAKLTLFGQEITCAPNFPRNRLCFFHLRGFCHFGSNCRFFHPRRQNGQPKPPPPMGPYPPSGPPPARNAVPPRAPPPARNAVPPRAPPPMGPPMGPTMGPTMVSPMGPLPMGFLPLGPPPRVPRPPWPPYIPHQPGSFVQHPRPLPSVNILTIKAMIDNLAEGFC